MTTSELLAAAVDDLIRSSTEIEAAAIVSSDGLPVASALPAYFEEERLAAMSASLLTLGEKAAEEFGRSRLSQVFVEGVDGHVVLMAAGDAVLVGVATRRAKIGLVLYEMRRTAGKIAEVMRAGGFGTDRSSEPTVVRAPLDSTDTAIAGR